MNMNERIKLLRKSLGLSQSEFGQRIGITFTAVSKIEVGTNVPSEQTVKLICSTYHVNYLWLTRGEGDMMEALDRPALVEQAMAGESPLAVSIMKAFAELPDREWERLRDLIDRIKNEGRP